MAEQASTEKAQAHSRLREYFLVESSAHSNRWDALWQDGSFLPWDRGEPAPALIDVVDKRQDLIGTAFAQPSQGQNATASSSESVARVRRKALVPGCGRGYDCYLLQARGWDVTGLDVSAAAVEQAKAFGSQIDDNGIFAANEGGKGEISFEAGDFFKLGEEYMEKWDLIWDYTFLCALPLDLRPKWAKQMTRLLSPGGRLVCLEFPTYKDPKAGGPPFALPSHTYVALLFRPGDTIQYGEDGRALSEDQQGSKNALALTRVAHFQPERTFPAGQGTDMVSVWKKP